MTTESALFSYGPASVRGPLGLNRRLDMVGTGDLAGSVQVSTFRSGDGPRAVSVPLRQWRRSISSSVAHLIWDDERFAIAIHHDGRAIDVVSAPQSEEVAVDSIVDAALPRALGLQGHQVLHSALVETPSGAIALSSIHRFDWR